MLESFLFRRMNFLFGRDQLPVPEGQGGGLSYTGI